VKKLLVILLALWLMMYPVYSAADIQLSCGQSGPTGADAFNINRTSTTVLTINPNATSTNIETARVAESTYRFTSAATATISAGSGTAYVYVDSAGVLTVGDNGLTVVCSGCTHVGSTTSYPIDAIPLWTWTATTGTWDSSGGTDNRASQFRSGLANTSSNGLIARTGANGAVAARTLQATAGGGFTWSNSDGVGGNPTPVIAMPSPFYLGAAGCNNATASSFWDLPTATPAAAACVTGTNIQKGVLDYLDTSGGFSAQYTLALPVDWTTGTLPDINIYWTTTATSGNAKWTVQLVCTAVNASATDDPAFPSSSNGFNTVTTAAPGSASQVQTSTITGATVPASCASATKELLHIRLFRDGNDAADTIAATARFIGMMVTPRRAW
jgi:hypothetical protein